MNERKSQRTSQENLAKRGNAACRNRQASLSSFHSSPPPPPTLAGGEHPVAEASSRHPAHEVLGHARHLQPPHLDRHCGRHPQVRLHVPELLCTVYISMSMTSNVPGCGVECLNMNRVGGYSSHLCWCQLRFPVPRRSPLQPGGGPLPARLRAVRLPQRLRPVRDAGHTEGVPRHTAGVAAIQVGEGRGFTTVCLAALIMNDLSQVPTGLMVTFQCDAVSTHTLMTSSVTCLKRGI